MIFEQTADGRIELALQVDRLEYAAVLVFVEDARGHGTVDEQRVSVEVRERDSPYPLSVMALKGVGEGVGAVVAAGLPERPVTV